MGRMHTRLSEEIEPDIEAYIDAEDVDRRTAIRQLVAKGLESWRREQHATGDPLGERTRVREPQERGIDRCGVSLGSQKTEI